MNRQRPSRFWIVSIALHAVALALIASSLTMRGGLQDWLRTVADEAAGNDVTATAQPPIRSAR